jgi:hypothetical protein
VLTRSSPAPRGPPRGSTARTARVRAPSPPRLPGAAPRAPRQPVIVPCQRHQPFVAWRREISVNTGPRGTEDEGGSHRSTHRLHICARPDECLGAPQQRRTGCLPPLVAGARHQLRRRHCRLRAATGAPCAQCPRHRDPTYERKELTCAAATKDCRSHRTGPCVKACVKAWVRSPRPPPPRRDGVAA